MNTLPTLLDTNAAAADVGRPLSTIRRWAHENRFQAYGRDKRGRRLYNIADVRRVARELDRTAGKLW